MGKVKRHTLGASLNIRHNLYSSKVAKPLQLKLLTTYIPKPSAFTLAFSTSQRLRTTRASARTFFTFIHYITPSARNFSRTYTQGKREQFSGFNRTLDAINNVFRKFSAFHEDTGRLNVDGMNIISNDGSNKLNRSRKARGSYKVQRTINASFNAATSTRAVSSNSNFVTRQKIEIIYGEIQNGRSLNELNSGRSGLETYGLFSNLTHDFLPISGCTASDSDSNPRSFKMSTRESLPSTKCDSYQN